MAEIASPPAPPEDLVRRLARIVGAGNVLSSDIDRFAYARDRAPFGTYRLREGRLPEGWPGVVVRPADAGEVASVLRLATARCVPVVPYGAGSGVLGGAASLGGEIVIDLKRLSGVIEIDPVDHTASVCAGMNGALFEAELRRNGFTCGHLPQSLAMSTVGGWVACRGAGQASSRYGKIEDMVLGLEVVLPDGRLLDIRPQARRSTGPDLAGVFVGSEGTLGVVVSATLRIWPAPAARRNLAVGFASLEGGLDCLRSMMQAGLRPAVVRLYDAVESAARTQSLDAGDRDLFLCLLSFEGLDRLVKAEEAEAMEMIARAGGRRIADGPFHDWEAVRYQSYSPQHQAAGRFMDTIEVTLPWHALPEGYGRLKAAALRVAPGAHFGAHWSHVYPDGACQYMTLRLDPTPLGEGEALHRAIWDAIERECVALGGAIAHHHGIGLLRGRWMELEHGAAGFGVIAAVKRAIDPLGIMNPGKLGLPVNESASGAHARSASNV
jgi:alkyldihydroxyacetonephosphate synthase